jgi:hypothetical protein
LCDANKAILWSITQRTPSRERAGFLAITSDAGWPYRELDDAVGLTDTAANTLADSAHDTRRA